MAKKLTLKPAVGKKRTHLHNQNHLLFLITHNIIHYIKPLKAHKMQ